jgi:AcrR family transcriptional regulator
MSVAIHIRVNSKLFNKDPQLSELGQNILKNSIILIDELGIASFTFKKLAERINSTEASIYRYFENKQLLLHYLINWYWEYVKARIEFGIANIEDPNRKLRKIFQIIISSSQRDIDTEYIDEDILYRIVLLEGSALGQTKSVDEYNSHGFFLTYKEIVCKIAEIILELNPNYPYPQNTANMLLLVALTTKHNAQHLPRLTDIVDSEQIDDDLYDLLCHYMDLLILKFN